MCARSGSIVLTLYVTRLGAVRFFISPRDETGGRGGSFLNCLLIYFLLLTIERLEIKRQWEYAIDMRSRDSICRRVRRLASALLSSQGFSWILISLSFTFYSRAQYCTNVNMIGAASIGTAMLWKLCPKISNSGNLNRISTAALPLPVFHLALYRDIGADRSTLKPHFTPSNYMPKWHRAFPFFLSFRAFHSLHPRPTSSRLLPYPRYIFARFLHSSSFEPSEKGFVREPFILPRVSRPDASGPTFRW